MVLPKEVCGALSLGSEQVEPVKDAFQEHQCQGPPALSTPPGTGCQVGAWLGLLLPRDLGPISSTSYSSPHSSSESCLSLCRPEGSTQTLMWMGGKEVSVSELGEGASSVPEG